MKYVNNIYKKINKCRISGDTKLITVAKFPSMGLTGTFPKNRNQEIKKTPFEVVFLKNQNFYNLNIIIILIYSMEKIMVIGLVLILKW